MSFVNNITIMGNLLGDPDLKSFENGSVCNFGIASNRKYKTKSGENAQETCFVDVETWGKLSETCAKYLAKGKLVLIQGRLKLNSWEQDGERRKKHVILADKVVFLNGGKGDQKSEERENNKVSKNYDDSSLEFEGFDPPFDDKNKELPF